MTSSSRLNSRRDDQDGVTGPLPPAIRRQTWGYHPRENTIGCSAARVFHLTRSDAPSLYLKVEPDNPDEELSAEHARLLRLARYLPVPAVHGFERAGGHTYLLTAEVAGDPAHDHHAHGLGAAQVVALLAAGLRRWHAVPIAACPFDHRLSVMLAHLAALGPAGRCPRS